MFTVRTLAAACAWLCAAASAHAASASASSHASPKAEVIHWWTSGGESAAVKQVAQAYRNAGGVWIDTAIAGGDQSRAVTINRIVGGNPPTAAQFNTSKQFLDVIEAGMLNNVDTVARAQNWDQLLPAPIIDVIKVDGHYYAVPLNIHMQTWFWYSKSAFRKAGIAKEPESMAEFFAALDKLKAAGIIPLAHGGQAWQETVLFSAILANMGGKELYLKSMRDRDQATLLSPAFRKVLLTFKRLKAYVDAGAPGRNWNDATALVISGRAGFQVMGDWAKGEFTNARQVAGRHYGCMAGLGPGTPYLIQGDVFVFPRTDDAQAVKAQNLLANVVSQPGLQVGFSKLKGSIPVRTDVNAAELDLCAQKGIEIMKDRARQAGVTEVYLTPDQNGAMQDVLTAYWNTNMPAEKAQRSIANALKY
ncbi:ABC transporter substrate-binding protein [Massilia yuzhufengensis]|uniref:Probable sugar-binding periplasmic protein n=1 Tax=Massilia yuzhufengensis TaxID=1164594 RepID=A0A1I1DUP3_9BURK|nr:ABC transporter substrate-binding protein [Massilia yuzhufengensis]SFB76430.1 carbohydrate ABC transporter substrate-binding protein, CUT1 family [Massilia yuzhufengensis]